jgi:hypothetical protein
LQILDIQEAEPDLEQALFLMLTVNLDDFFLSFCGNLCCGHDHGTDSGRVGMIGRLPLLSESPQDLASWWGHITCTGLLSGILSRRYLGCRFPPVLLRGAPQSSKVGQFQSFRRSRRQRISKSRSLAGCLCLQRIGATQKLIPECVRHFQSSSKTKLLESFAGGSDLNRNFRKFHLTTFASNFGSIAWSQKHMKVHKGSQAAEIPRKSALGNLLS